MGKESAKLLAKRLVGGVASLSISLFVLSATVTGLWTGWREASLIPASFNWPSTQGQVIESQIQTYLSDYDDEDIEFRYRYEVDGNEYIRRNIGLGFSGAGRDDIRRYHEGERITVYYRPISPEIAFLDHTRHRSRPSFTGVAFGLVFSGIFGSVGLRLLRETIAKWRGH